MRLRAPWRASAVLVALGMSAAAFLTAASWAAPLTVTATAQGDQLVVEWSTRTYSFGPTVYQVKAEARERPGWVRECPGGMIPSDGRGAPTQSCAIAGLTRGWTYDVTVLAYCLTSAPLLDCGSGQALGVVLCCSVPGPVMPGTVTDHGSGSATLTWQPPTDTGGATNLDYAITTTPPTTGCTTQATQCTLTGLPYDTPITATITATNTAGTSPPATYPPITLTPPPPTAPTTVRATLAPGTTTATITWKPPTTPANITAYLATSTPTGLRCRTTRTQCTITGLKPGTTYAFTVTAYHGTTKGTPSRPSPTIQTPTPKPNPTPTKPPQDLT